MENNRTTETYIVTVRNDKYNDNCNKVIKVIESTRNITRNFIGENDNQSFYDKFFNGISNSNRGIIHKPGTVNVLKDGEISDLKLKEKTKTNGLELTWDSIKEILPRQ